MDDKLQPTPGTSINPGETPRVSIPVMDDIRVPVATSTMAMNNRSQSTEEVINKPTVEPIATEPQASEPIEVQNTIPESAPITEPSFTQPPVETQAQINPTPNQQPKKKASLKIVIILVVVVVVSLAGIAVYAYMQSNNKEVESTTTVTTKEVKVTSDDAQTTITDIEKEVNTQNEDTDFNTGALSDATLGL